MMTTSWNISVFQRTLSWPFVHSFRVLAFTFLLRDTNPEDKITGAFCGFAKETVRFHVSKMCSIFITHVAPNCIRWPSSDEEIQKIKQDFLDRGYIENVVGAIDGTHIPILIPVRRWSYGFLESEKLSFVSFPSNCYWHKPKVHRLIRWLGWECAWCPGFPE